MDNHACDTNYTQYKLLFSKIVERGFGHPLLKKEMYVTQNSKYTKHCLLY
jgi:hypothetical protein